MEKKLVSVIIPTRNRAKIIRKAIDSVLNQTYQNFEIIVIDNGSSDNTKEVVEAYNDERIKYFWQKNSGQPAGARNTGFKHIRGEYIAFLDDDDLWLPKKLEIQVKYLEKNDNLLAVSSNGIRVSETFNEIFLHISKNTLISYRELLKGNPIINSSVIIRSSVIESIGYQDTNIRAAADYDYWLRILKFRDNSFLILKDILMKWGFHEIHHTFMGISFLEEYRIVQYILKKHRDYDSYYVDHALRMRIYQFKLNKLKNLFLKKEISIFAFINHKNINLKHKLKFLLHYYNKKYHLNFIINNILIKKYLYFVIKKIYKLGTLLSYGYRENIIRAKNK